MIHVYLPPKQSGDPFTVGFYTPDAKWVPISDHQTDKAAAERVHWLNGGRVSDTAEIQELRKACFKAYAYIAEVIPWLDSKRTTDAQFNRYRQLLLEAKKDLHELIPR